MRYLLSSLSSSRTARCRSMSVPGLHKRLFHEMNTLCEMEQSKRQYYMPLMQAPLMEAAPARPRRRGLRGA